MLKVILLSSVVWYFEKHLGSPFNESGSFSYLKMKLIVFVEGYFYSFGVCWKWWLVFWRGLGGSSGPPIWLQASKQYNHLWMKYTNGIRGSFLLRMLPFAQWTSHGLHVHQYSVWINLSLSRNCCKKAVTFFHATTNAIKELVIADLFFFNFPQN